MEFLYYFAWVSIFACLFVIIRAWRIYTNHPYCFGLYDDNASEHCSGCDYLGDCTEKEARK